MDVSLVENCTAIYLTAFFQVTFAFSDYETDIYDTKKVLVFFIFCSTFALDRLNVRSNNAMGFKSY